MLSLAGLTSFIMLIVFALVNASLFLIGRKPGAPEVLRKWRWWGVAGAMASTALAVAEAVT
jgi:amino acid transporter